MIDDWKIIGDIGEGGQAWVHKVADRQGNEYALKRFKNPKRIERINEEILNGKNMWALGLSVPQIIADGIDSKKHAYFVTPYYSNGNLRRAFDTYLKELDKKFEFSLLLCHNIREINNHKYAHRDLKPENILLDNDFNPVICDLGLSHNLEREKRLSHDGEPIGSTHYLHRLAFDMRAVDKSLHTGFDGYSFAKILYEILVGDQLFGFERINLTNNPLEKLISDKYDRFLILKLTRLINRLLDDDINVVYNYWNKFPRELDIVLNTKSQEFDLKKDIAERLRDHVARLSSKIEEPAMATEDDFNLLIAEIEEVVKTHPIITYYNDLLTQHEHKELIKFKNNVNIREILEGVGIKSHYGIEPLTGYGRKQPLVLKEMLIEIPTMNTSVGISILDNNPKATVILFHINRSRDFIDIDDSSIESVSVDPTSTDTNDLIDVLSKFVGATIGGE